MIENNAETNGRAMPDVMVLAAGQGRRMRPLTETVPKPLVPVAGTPLIQRVLAAAAHEGCARFVVNAHYKAAQIEATVADIAAASEDFSFALSHEPDLLDTGGGVKQALPLLRGDPFFVMNADSFWLPGYTTPLGALLESADASDTDMTLLCVRPDNALGLRGEPDFECRSDGRLARSGGEPVHYAGAMLVRRAIIENGPEGPFSLYDLMVRLEKEGRLFGTVLETDWFHIGDVGAIVEAERKLGAPV